MGFIELFHGLPTRLFFSLYKPECSRDFFLFPIDNLPSWVKITSLVGFTP